MTSIRTRTIVSLLRSPVLVGCLAGTLVAGPLASPAEQSSGRPLPGAYCPLPEPGQQPVCLTPAQARYQEFFTAIESGDVDGLDEKSTASIEADLLSSGEENEDAYLALSSISYGYYRLAGQVGKRPESDPALLARLESWNRLLLESYGASESDPRFRAALREAAADLHDRTPDVGELCGSSEDAAQCSGAEGLVRALARIDTAAGLRSPLTRVMNRMLGEPQRSGDVTRPVSGER